MKFWNKIKIFTYLFIGFIYIQNISSANAAKIPSSIVFDAITGDIIHSDNPDKIQYPASLTKLMTLYLTFNAIEQKKINLDTQLTASFKASQQEASHIELRRGDTISVKDAIMALIVKSANDCAIVLAEAIGKDEKGFAQLMNQKAKELGMKNTTFKNPHGLHNNEQKTTARDMAILASAIYHHFPEYYDLFSTKTFSYKGKKYSTHNHLLKHFKGADGMKTGYTRKAGYNIITSAQWGNKRVIAVTMGHKTLKNRDYKVADLMKSGLTKLNNKSNRKLYAKLDIPPLKTNSNDKNWTIQIGAFSNYIRARNHALMVQNNIHLPYANKSSINVDASPNNGAVIYHSQIKGLAKNEADKICYSLKKSNKSCTVIKSNQQLAMAE